MPYFESGYIAEGYYEGDVISPIVPNETIVNISRSFILDGVDISSHVDEVSILKSNNKAYHTLSLTLSNYDLNPLFVKNKNIRLITTIGTDSYSFIIFDDDKDYKNNHEIIAKTQGCLLEFPFSPQRQNEAITGSSNQVISDLCKNIQFYNSLPDFNFDGGSFLLNGSSLDSIKKIVSVSGGTMYEKNNTLYFEKRFRISEGASPKFIFNDNILLSKIKSDNIDGSPLINKITFNAGADNGVEVYSEPKISMQSDDDCKPPFFIFNPCPKSTNEINSNLGNISLTFKELIYEETISDTRTIILNGGITRIKMISINGTPTSNYDFTINHNVLILNDTYTGTVKVVYVSRVAQRYTKRGDYNPTNNTYSFNVQYLNQLLQETIKCDVDNSSNGDIQSNTSSSTESCSVSLIDDIKLDIPFSFDVDGDITCLMFQSNQSKHTKTISGIVKSEIYGDFESSFVNNISRQSIEILRNSNFTIEDVSDELGWSGEYFGFISDLDLDSFMLGSIEISFTKRDKADYTIYYITNEDFIGLSVSAQYSKVVTRYTVPACGAGNTVKSIGIIACGGSYTFDYPTSSSDPDDPTVTNITLLPATININVASLFNFSVAKCATKVVQDDAGKNHVVLANGTFDFFVSTQRKHTIKCDTIHPNAKIFVDATNAGLKI